MGLARRGFEVALYDKRPDPREVPPAADRSLMIVLSARGFRALDALGISERVRELCLPIAGREIHGKDGKSQFQPYGAQGEAQQAISREAINLLLVELAAKEPGVSLHFQRECVDLDPSTGSVEFVDPTGQRYVDKGDRVFGSDGAYSAVRQRLQRRQRFDYSQQFLSHVYREVVVAQTDQAHKRLRRDAFHVWPREELMLAGFPNRDGSVGLSLYLPFEGKGPHTNEKIATVEALHELFDEEFPDVADLLRPSAEVYLQSPVGHLVTIKCFPWVQERVALIGDACHAILPFYGQGVNAGFEDCQMLFELVDAEQGAPDWSQVLQRYQHARKPNTDAIADISIENFEILQSAVGRESYLRRLALERRLASLFPDLKSPSLYANVTFRGMPYGEARELDRRFATIIDHLAQLESGGQALSKEAIGELLDGYRRRPEFAFLR